MRSKPAAPARRSLPALRTGKRSRNHILVAPAATAAAAAVPAPATAAAAPAAVAAPAAAPGPAPAAAALRKTSGRVTWDQRNGMERWREVHQGHCPFTRPKYRHHT